MTEAAPKGRRRLALRALQAAAVVAAAYFLVAYLIRSWDAVNEFEWTLSTGWLLASGAVFLTYYFLQAMFWWLLLRGCGADGPFWPAAAVWGKSILGRYVPGSVVMFVGRAWLSHSQGLSVERVSAAMVYEQAMGVTSALLTVALLFPFWEHHPGLTALALLAVPILVALMHPRIFAPLSARALRLLRRPALDVTMRFGAVFLVLALFVVDWLVAGLGAWLLARSLTGLELRALPLCAAAYALAYVAGMIAFIIPSGIGVREAVLTASLARRLPGGVAMVWALGLRVWVTVMELLFVGLVVAVELLLSRRATGGRA
jgi:uncharacterized membrane protein YbhN (UPF0104 family)